MTAGLARDNLPQIFYSDALVVFLAQNPPVFSCFGLVEYALCFLVFSKSRIQCLNESSNHDLSVVPEGVRERESERPLQDPADLSLKASDRGELGFAPVKASW